jgi:hypothetical protein
MVLQMILGAYAPATGNNILKYMKILELKIDAHI